MTMTPEAKSRLSRVIRGTQNANNGGLRDTLLEELESETRRRYRLNIKSIKKADLSEANETKRRRLQEWLDEQVRSETGKEKRTEDDFLKQAVKQAAYTLLNRIVILRLMEGMGLRSLNVLTGGWNSQGYRDFQFLAKTLVRDDSDRSEGYSFLLKLIFEDLATELPGLFGSAGIADLIPVPDSLLKTVVEAIDDPELETCWSDDMTLGWVYQYWNDPEREAIDAKLNDGGKVEPHEIASKTQMFTERYMVDWLLQNSLGPMWLAMCRQHGWTPDCEADGVLDALEERRVDWRTQRDAGEVELTELMPLHNEAERRWAYYVPQPIPVDAVEHAAESVRDLKILDPAVGSGHFLVVAFDLLFALYKEEARHRGGAEADQWTDTAIVERILEHNLHGIDLDPRAVQIAAAALWLKAQTVCSEAKPKQLNLVASKLGIASLRDDDPGLVELRRTVEEETGIPATLTNSLIEALQGADHLGSLLKVDSAIADAIQSFEDSLGLKDKVDRVLFNDQGEMLIQSGGLDKGATEEGIIAALENFLDRHTSAEELGLRLHGEQLAAGVRFVRMVKEDRYDLIVANPPYQGTSKLQHSEYIEAHYRLGKADLYAAFLLRGLELVRPHGVSAMLTMRNWMFIRQYSGLRENLLRDSDVRALGDFAVGAFDEVPNDLLSVVVSVIHGTPPVTVNSIAQQPTATTDASYDRLRTQRKRAATIAHVGCNEFDSAALSVVANWPLVHWWTPNQIAAYAAAPKLHELMEGRLGCRTSDNVRFLRNVWELPRSEVWAYRWQDGLQLPPPLISWVPYIKGAAGKQWAEPLATCISWKAHGFEVGVTLEEKYNAYPQSSEFYFRRGIAFAMIGIDVGGRAHRFASVIGDKGSSVYPENIPAVLATLNSAASHATLNALNPSMSFQVGDVLRLPLLNVVHADEVLERVDEAFAASESHNEPSIEYRAPGPSTWTDVQRWAQRAVDLGEGEPLPEYVKELDPEPPTDHISFAVGVALGRFGPNGEGILNPESDNLDHALPHGILFLDGTLADTDLRDDLGHDAAQVIHNTWTEHGSDSAANIGVRKWLRTKFFPDVHKGMYENRPIHWPLTSAGKIFIAWINIHRWNARTLTHLLAKLNDTLRRIDGEIEDLKEAVNSPDKSTSRDARDDYDDRRKWRDELKEFVDNVQQCADKGPLPPDVAAGKKAVPPRDCDAPYDPDLDDGVMINSAALWPLLDPVWKDPKKWWIQLAHADPKGNKDYDWSHLAMKYWPERVDGKCQTDPSLAVAHGCFWKYHPAKAWKWELRLQDEIGPDFQIEEAPYRDDDGHEAHRTTYLATEPAESLETAEKELIRRRGKKDNIRIINEMTLLEPGLWSAEPEFCFEIESKFIKKQKAPFRLMAPDEVEARENLLEAKPGLRKNRNELMNKIAPVGLFAGDEE